MEQHRTEPEPLAPLEIGLTCVAIRLEAEASNISYAESPGHTIDSTRGGVYASIPADCLTKHKPTRGGSPGSVLVKTGPAQDWDRAQVSLDITSPRQSKSCRTGDQARSAGLKTEFKMADVRVRCINKTPRDDTHHGITHLGGDGWKWPRQQVIDSIKAKTNTFFTMEGGKRADIGVNRNAYGEYLQTYADGQWNNNLLSLPECV